MEARSGPRAEGALTNKQKGRGSVKVLTELHSEKREEI